MITFFRRIFQSKLGLFLTFVFVALIAVAFATADVSSSGAFGGVASSDTAVEIGDSELTVAELEESVNNAFQAAQRQNPGLDMKTFVDQGGFDDVLERMINSYAIAEYGQMYGMSSGKRLVDSEIASIPAFQGADGKFSEDVFRLALQQRGLSEASLRNDIFRNLIADQLMPTAQFGTATPDKLVAPYAALLLERRKGQIAQLPAVLFAPKELPDEKTIAAYFKENGDDYRIPERRSIRYATFELARFEKIVKVSDKEVSGYYDLNKKNYAATERRRFKQIIVPTEAAAKSLAKRIGAGEAIDKVADEAGLSAAEIGPVNKAELVSQSSQAVADAVFAVGEGKVAKPAQSGLGWHVADVAQVTKVKGRSLAEATPEIRTTLTAEKVQDAVAEFATRLEEEFASGTSLQEIAKAEELKIQETPAIVANGQDPEDARYKPSEDVQKIVPRAFAMQEDGDPQVIEITPGQKYAVFELAEIVAAAPPPLERIEKLVVRDYMLSKGNVEAEKVAKQIAKEVQNGKSLREAMIAAKGPRLPAPQAVNATRADLSRKDQQAPPPLVLMFSMAKGTAKTLKVPRNQGWFVIALDEVIPGDASKREDLLKATGQQFSRFIGQEYADQFIDAIKAGLNIKRNDSAIQTLKDRLAGRGN